MLEEVNAKTLSDTLAEMKAKPLAVVLADWLKEVEPDNNVKIEAVVDALAVRTAQVESDKLGKTLAEVNGNELV